jgi:hypothetical protein
LSMASTPTTVDDKPHSKRSSTLPARITLELAIAGKCRCGKAKPTQRRGSKADSTAEARF